ncbi:hypothetical protein COO60DRAFT_425061 [Scenedesmus sp. NREL 46B-D3]|nr:hypothetical protein COO60DRAFT_425061 [Scenedesmus sp. NREL 46B-D3]
MLVTVRTLDGHALDVEVDTAGCVKDVRRVLVEQHGLAKCALYLQARQLSMKTPLAELNLKDADILASLAVLCLSCLPCRRRSPPGALLWQHRKAAAGAARQLSRSHRQQQQQQRQRQVQAILRLPCRLGANMCWIRCCRGLRQGRTRHQ